jgi:hypothetical protein
MAQSARAQLAVRGFNARVAIWTSKSQSKSRFSRLDFALEVIIEALEVLKGEVAEPKGQFLSACREPEQGSGCGGCGNASIEVEVVQQRFFELIASHGAENLCSGKQDVVQRPGLPELIAESARSAAGLGGSAGGVCKTPWWSLCESSTDFAPGAGEAAVTSYSAAQGITGDQALASIAQRATAEQLPMAVVFSALDADRHGQRGGAGSELVARRAEQAGASAGRRENRRQRGGAGDELGKRRAERAW